jgi:hypothetical protein
MLAATARAAHPTDTPRDPRGGYPRGPCCHQDLCVPSGCDTRDPSARIPRSPAARWDGARRTPVHPASERFTRRVNCGPRAQPRQGASASDAIRANPAPRGEPRGYRVQGPRTRASCVPLDDPKSPAQAGLVRGSPGVHPGAVAELGARPNRAQHATFAGWIPDSTLDAPPPRPPGQGPARPAVEPLGHAAHRGAGARDRRAARRRELRPARRAPSHAGPAGASRRGAVHLRAVLRGALAGGGARVPAQAAAMATRPAQASPRRRAHVLAAVRGAADPRAAIPGLRRRRGDTWDLPQRLRPPRDRARPVSRVTRKGRMRRSRKRSKA